VEPLHRLFKLLALAALVSLAAAAAASGAHKAHRTAPLLAGFIDEAQMLYGDPSAAFATLETLHAQVVRVNLYWGGTKWAVANQRPANPTDPGDPAYDWTLYDRLVRYAADRGIHVVFSILFTPAWANDGRGRNVAPRYANDLRHFAYAAAVRYSGFWSPPEAQQDAALGDPAAPLPAVTMWTAWNEPNNPIWLAPQYKRVNNAWRIESAYQYARICNAVYEGVHAVLISPERGAVPGEQVACGLIGPRGNDAPRSARPQPDQIAFMVAAKRYGLRTFDVWAHHPYPLSGTDLPTYVPRPQEHAVVLGNIGTLLTKLTQLWGPKHLWITEYGYQTNPPNRTAFGVSWRKQATYMRQAFAMARANSRIDMMLWFLVRDDSSRSGWQSGVETASGALKPSFGVFANLQR
jgi:Glycosyl hydrolase catalytic core